VSSRLPVVALIVATALLVGLSLSLRVEAHKRALFSDEATYHSMAWSLAEDGDLRYQHRDLVRVYALGYDAGPTGLFLQRDPESGDLHFAKAFVYSLAAAPFVATFADNGFYLLHALLFGLVVAAGYAWLRRTLSPARAATFTFTYFAASVAVLYLFWITPEWFNLSAGFLATFLWLYKERPPGWPEDAPWRPEGWLAGGWTDLGAAALYGIAAYSKPPSIILAGPLLVWLLWRRRPGRAVVAGVVLLAVVVGLFAGTWAITGEWNYMGGDRKSFYGPYPYQSRADTFDSIRTGTPMVTDLADYSERIPRPDVLAADLVYLWVGRNGGLLVYMFPAVMGLLLFLGAPDRRLASPYGLLILAFFASALAYMTVIQGNWIGGGGTVGARYFVPFYFVPFFLIPAGAGLLGPVVSWLVAALFLTPILASPFESSFEPARHTKGFPYRLLPPELTMLNDLPFNTNPRARRVDLGHPEFDVYFLDDNTWGREPGTGGFWLRPGTVAEVVVRTAGPARQIILDVQNGPVDNHVRVTLDGDVAETGLEADAGATLWLRPTVSFRYQSNRVYRLTFEAEEGFIPLFAEAGATDTRHLAVLVRPRVVLHDDTDSGTSDSP